MTLVTPVVPNPAEYTIDDVQLAAELGLSLKTIQSWRRVGIGPRYLKLGRLVRYSRADIDAWLAASIREPQSHRAG